MTEHIVHPIPPLYDADSRVLILGSFPSVKSREAAFFYGHPQNRFWRVMARVLGCETPGSVPEKAAMLPPPGAGASEARVSKNRAKECSLSISSPSFCPKRACPS